MDKYVEVCNQYMFWLAKDEQYGLYLTNQKISENPKYATSKEELDKIIKERD